MSSHNPERKEFKGRSYKKGGVRVKELKHSEIVLDWNEQIELDFLREALEPFDLTVIDHPACEGSDSYGFIISNRPLTEEEYKEAEEAL